MAPAMHVYSFSSPSAQTIDRCGARASTSGQIVVRIATVLSSSFQILLLDQDVDTFLYREIRKQ